jgi:L-amino acid N-acyltransferase
MIGIEIRKATTEDTGAIAEIYNQAIAEGIATFDSFPVDAERYAPLLADPQATLVVATVSDRVVGWASVSPISTRWAYRFTCLGSFFVHKDFRKQGIGSALKAAQIEEARTLGYHSLVVEILSTNFVSVSLNLNFGFRIVGEITEAGYRHGKWIGLIVMQKSLEQNLLDHQFRFSIVTDDFEKSVSLYKDALSLKMTPISGPIAMFPLGMAEFEVCLRESAKDVLDYQFPAERADGILISLKFDSDIQLNHALESALACGATQLESQSRPNAVRIRDFNGVSWSLEVGT